MAILVVFPVFQVHFGSCHDLNVKIAKIKIICIYIYIYLPTFPGIDDAPKGRSFRLKKKIYIYIFINIYKYISA